MENVVLLGWRSTRQRICVIKQGYKTDLVDKLGRMVIKAT